MSRFSKSCSTGYAVAFGVSAALCLDGCAGTAPSAPNANAPQARSESVIPSAGANAASDGASKAAARVVTRLLGHELPLASSGSVIGTARLLDSTGYVGTYLRLDAPARVEILVRARGHADQQIAPRMNIVVADGESSFDVAPAPTAYRHTAELAPGTHVIRIEYVNDAPNSSRELAIEGLAVNTGALLPENTDAHALAAADTYIQHYRRGRAKVFIQGARPGTTAKIRLERHAFNFGTNIPYATNRLIPERVEPNSDAEKYQRMLRGRFNTIVLSNGGKWLYQEPTRDKVELAYIDRFFAFAEEHGYRTRMHTMLWDTSQQPAWVVSEDPKRPGLLTLATRSDARARRELDAEIDERIEHYVKARARHYQELDVLNESLHRARYHQVYRDRGIADVFKRVARAATEGKATTRLCLNEYNLLQWSTDPRNGASDPYANWYRQHAENIAREGAPLDCLGIQYYADGRGADEIGSNAHSPARIFQVLQNLSVAGHRLSLTEFSVNAKATPERAADILEHVIRLVFGTARADSFLIWAIWAGAADPPAPASALFDVNQQLTEAGRRYDALMRNFGTNVDVDLTVGEGGVVEFVGFFGEYRIDVGREAYRVSLERGIGEYRVPDSP